jgi:monoterpene epsilon-lactone hydrolase
MLSYQDYRLAPEHPFPSAVKDVEASYRGLADNGITKIALSCDLAGGSLALVLLSVASGQASSGGVVPAGAVALSPVTDLALTGESFITRAEADPYFTRPQAAALVRSYLGDADSRNQLASPLYANLAGLPAIRIHVGDDEVMLDDSRRYVKRAVGTSGGADEPDSDYHCPFGDSERSAPWATRVVYVSPQNTVDQCMATC